jgi:hypothetical protein
MTEVRFKPADVGSVADGTITPDKLAEDFELDVAKVTGAVAGTGTTGDKTVTKIGWDSATGEVVIDHE